VLSATKAFAVMPQGLSTDVLNLHAAVSGNFVCDCFYDTSQRVTWCLWNPVTLLVLVHRAIDEWL